MKKHVKLVITKNTLPYSLISLPAVWPQTEPFEFILPLTIFTSIAATTISHYSASLLSKDMTSNGTANTKSHFRHCCPQRSSFASPVWFPELLPCYKQHISTRYIVLICSVKIQHFVKDRVLSSITTPNFILSRKLLDRVEEAFCTGRSGPDSYFGSFGLESNRKLASVKFTDMVSPSGQTRKQDLK